MIAGDSRQLEPVRRTETDHQVWRRLYAQQADLVRRHASREYLEGFERLAIPTERAADLDTVNEAMRGLGKWRFVPVTEFLPPRDFFDCLCAHRFPVRITMRRPDELEFSALPDLFHDLFGHGPQLFSPVLGPIIEELGRAALRHAADPALLGRISTLFWVTFEIGLVTQGDQLKAYGGAILSSLRETKNVFEQGARTAPLDLGAVVSTEYVPQALQQWYPVIRSYDEILILLHQIEEGRSTPASPNGR